MTDETRIKPALSLVRQLTYQTKSQTVYEELRRRILLGRLEPGQRLDQEWLADELQVSRMPLRQALLRLEADGLIENRPHRSAIVAPLSAPDLEDVYFTRRALESMLAEAAAVRIPANDIGRLNELMQKQKVAIQDEDVEKYVALDRSFHATLYQASGYARACEILERLRDSSDRYVRFYARDRRAVDLAIGDHEEIIKACQSRDSALVRRVTEAHITEGFSSLIALVKRSEPT